MAKELGYGFSKEIYTNALAVELRKDNLKVAEGTPIDIFYDGVCVGTSQADLIVEEKVIVAVTVDDGIDAASIAQCQHDLKATGLYEFTPWDSWKIQRF